MKVLVCGGRDYHDEGRVYGELDKLHEYTPFTHLIHGGARGADTYAGMWALHHHIPATIYRARWETEGHAAGYNRNVRMAEANPALVIAFPGGTGTAMMIKIAKERNIPVHIVEP